MVTGGHNESRIYPEHSTRVVEYTEDGTMTYLARLNTGRWNHACSKFVNDNGDTVSL